MYSNNLNSNNTLNNANNNQNSSLFSNFQFNNPNISKNTMGIGLNNSYPEGKLTVLLKLFNI